MNAILCNTRQLVKRNPLAVGDSQTPVIPCNAPIITRNGMRLPGNSGTLRRYVSLHSVGGTPGRSVVAVSVALEGSGGGVTSECLEKTHKLPWAVVHERVGIKHKDIRASLPRPNEQGRRPAVSAGEDLGLSPSAALVYRRLREPLLLIWCGSDKGSFLPDRGAYSPE